MESKEPREYEIETIDQLINISTSENFERLSVDFLIWLDYVNKTFENFKADNPEHKDKNNSDIAKVKFIWVDDNKNEITNIQLKNSETGEIKNIKPNKK